MISAKYASKLTNKAYKNRVKEALRICDERIRSRVKGGYKFVYFEHVELDIREDVVAKLQHHGYKLDSYTDEYLCFCW